MGPTDRIKLALERFIQHVVARIDYLAYYRCRVVAQDADGTLQLQPDDAAMPGLTGVPIRYGVPGIAATLDLTNATYCFVGFEAGNPGRPFVAAWEPGALLALVIASGTNGAARLNDAVQVTIPAGSLHLAVSGAAASGPAADLTLSGSITGPCSAIVKVG